MLVLRHGVYRFQCCHPARRLSVSVSNMASSEEHSLFHNNVYCNSYSPNRVNVFRCEGLRRHTLRSRSWVWCRVGGKEIPNYRQNINCLRVSKMNLKKIALTRSTVIRSVRQMFFFLLKVLDWGPVPHFCPLEALQPVWHTPEAYCTIPRFLNVPTLAARCLSRPQPAVVP
jgi:hypothetical protein